MLLKTLLKKRALIGIAILLASLATSAQQSVAQNDSSWLVVYNRGVYSWSYDVTRSNGPGTESGVLDFRRDFSGHIPKQDTIGYGAMAQSLPVSFIIDSAASMLRHISFHAAAGFSGPVEGSIVFDSMQAIWIRPGYLLVPKNGYIGRYSWSGFSEFLHTTGSGSGGGDVVDTLMIQLFWPGVSAVKSSSNAIHSALRVDASTNTASFTPSEEIRELEILDVLGRRITALPVPAFAESIALPLRLRGLCIVRIDEQTAKFIALE